MHLVSVDSGFRHSPAPARKGGRRHLMIPASRISAGGWIVFLAVLCLGWTIAPLSAGAAETVLLKDLYTDDFLIGMAIEGYRDMSDPQVRHFNAVTPGNDLKWERVHPRPDRFNFAPGEAVAEFAAQHGMEFIGHTLIWHQQTPAWVFQDGQGGRASRELLLARMEEHIKTVVSHFCGRIRGWDVVNEALEENGTLRRSAWFEIIGEDYIEKAFMWAHEACPSAELYYNDYNLYDQRKRQGAIRIIRNLQAKGIPIHGVGEQAHYDVEWPPVQDVDRMIREFSQLGIKVLITELDMSVFPWTERRDLYRSGLPEQLAEQQARRYKELFQVFLKHRDVIDRVTFWGLTDINSWKNHFPVPGRRDYPLLFDRESEPKPAFWAVVEAARETRRAP